MQIKVNRTRLIAAIKDARTKAISDHSASILKFNGGFIAYKKGVEARMKEVAEAIHAATTIRQIEDQFKYGELKNMPDRPSEPSASPKTDQYDKALASLALCDEDVIVLNDNRDQQFLALIK